MDPTANLHEQLELVKRIRSGTLSTADLAEAATRLAELVDGLDAWIRSGGFLPEAWSPLGEP